MTAPPALTVALDGEALRLNVAMPTPVPFKDAFCGLPAALEETLTAADSLVVVEGVKLTLMVQLPPAASVLGETGQVLVCAKSTLLVPVRVMPLMVKAALPVFFTVKLC